MYRPKTFFSVGQALLVLADTSYKFGKWLFAGLTHQRSEVSPYINHPLALACLLAVDGGITGTATLCAALLHDTIEDTQTSADEIEREFRQEIRLLVEELTDKNLPKPERKCLQVEHPKHATPAVNPTTLSGKHASNSSTAVLAMFAAIVMHRVLQSAWPQRSAFKRGIGELSAALDTRCWCHYFFPRQETIETQKHRSRRRRSIHFRSSPLRTVKQGSRGRI